MNISFELESKNERLENLRNERNKELVRIKREKEKDVLYYNDILNKLKVLYYLYIYIYIY